MAKNNEKKIALALACVQVLGGRALAKDQFNHFRLKPEDFIATESRYCG